MKDIVLPESVCCAINLAKETLERLASGIVYLKDCSIKISNLKGPKRSFQIKRVRIKIRAHCIGDSISINLNQVPKEVAPSSFDIEVMENSSRGGLWITTSRPHRVTYGEVDYMIHTHRPSGFLDKVIRVE